MKCFHCVLFNANVPIQRKIWQHFWRHTTKSHSYRKTGEIFREQNASLLQLIYSRNHTEADVSCREAGVSHPADQRWPGSPDVPVAVVHIVDISSVQRLQV